MDGTLLEAWASVKSYHAEMRRTTFRRTIPAMRQWTSTEKSGRTRPRIEDGPGCEDGRKGKGKEAKLSYNGNLLVENRHGLIVDAEVFEANGTAERDAALVMLEQIPGTKQVTVGGDKGYDTADFVAECRNLKVTRTWRRTWSDPVGAPSMLVRRGTPDMLSVGGRGNAWKMLRLAEDDRAVAEGSASRGLEGRMGLHLCRSCL